MPTLSLFWLKKHEHDKQATGPLSHFQLGFERRFERLREGYRGALESWGHERNGLR